jgi:aerobic-type carbon monoxide dehydrogenase small subunit (CoxS/CutS family)
MPIVELKVNGVARRLEVEPEQTLLGALRDQLGLTGTKYGCGEGQCGACTVLVNGRATRSCQARVASAAGGEVTTIEGLAASGELHPVQEAFIAAGAMQCGYCTPGMILGAVALLARRPSPTEQEIGEGLEGHICRCGTYPRIVRAVGQAARAMKVTSR